MKGAALLLCQILTLPFVISEAQWVKEVGIEAAAKLLVNLPDGNYSNLVFVNDAIDDDSDGVWAQFVDVLKLNARNVISVRKQSVR